MVSAIKHLAGYIQGVIMHKGSAESHDNNQKLNCFWMLMGKTYIHIVRGIPRSCECEF